jgi:hypothetical protein
MKSIIERFLQKIQVSDSGCWDWVGYRDRDGYGRVTINKVPYGTHRIIYEYYHGQICPDLVIDHLCKNRKCVNPTHLEQVTNKENLRRSPCTSTLNSAKTHCIHGHEFNDKNTRYRPTGGRSCRICAALQARKYRLKSVITDRL